MQSIIAHIGAKSFFVIFLTAAFTGMVIGLKGYYTLTKFGSEGMLGSVVALLKDYSLFTVRRSGNIL